MFPAKSPNEDKKAVDKEKKHEKEENTRATTQSTNDDSSNQSTKTKKRTTTTDNDNEIYPPAKCLKQIDDSNIHQTEETKHDLTNDEESEGKAFCFFL
ncbi:unnamed protein product [Rotaria sp. Silwood1]|nr:unnamed protein product [Rotaria sp. Silwood1]CAF1691164.1 unnamed protein product [Rotaria sp. Silwood1]